MVLADSSRIARVPLYLGTPLSWYQVSATGLSPSLARLSRRLAYRIVILNAVPQPRFSFLKRFSLFRFRSPLLAESRLLSFPPGTEMFQFPGFASISYVFRYRSSFEGVAPFGHSRIKACSRLPMTFRSVPRPSSPPDAKASTECSYRALSQCVSRQLSVVRDNIN